jgi:RsiW-degrading membrane proteinase PrsW (M82 family)
MMFLLKLICAIAPVIILGGLLYHCGLGATITKKRLRRVFGWGCLSAIIIIIISCFGLLDLEDSYINILLSSAFPEELIKILIMLFLINKYKCKETLDILLICGSVGLGFACIENIIYIIPKSGWVTTAIMRALISIPGHFVYAIIMGFFINKSMNQSTSFKSKLQNLIFAFCAAVFLHWTKNANIYLLQNLNFNIYGVLSALFAYFATPIFLIFAFKYIKKVRATSVEFFTKQINKRTGL